MKIHQVNINETSQYKIEIPPKMIPAMAMPLFFRTALDDLTRLMIPNVKAHIAKINGSMRRLAIPVQREAMPNPLICLLIASST